MLRLVALLLSFVTVTCAADLPTRKWLNLAALKTMVAAAEAEAQKRNVQVTICIVDESGNLLFLQKADAAGLTTIQFAQKKARYAALYKRPSKAAADQLTGGNLQVLVMPDAFPNRGGLPIIVDGQTIGGMAASGSASEIDEAIAQAGIDALLKKQADAARGSWQFAREGDRTFQNRISALVQSNASNRRSHRPAAAAPFTT